ncbi:MerR family transcriptional regulator [Kineosporia sp. NBRC 101731]|uniref:MerR family transcriptional regulator n=1 Tax=Kineosporia sp. NBRC 101731 TaxID=3032199 RepID=UPI0024A0EAE0|nr:MerR family transcriptional regulator [Kineosporia sp. NBRC 101731]GLY27388.1 MerR family transcriptional regulator [Kineosporia sp. NBRC 101731]
MRIGDVAARSGASVRSLRYYEEQGLLESGRSTSGQRIYAEEAVERVQLIQMLYTAGLPSRRIQELLPCVETGVSTDHTRALLLTERERIDRQMNELALARGKLDEIISIAFDDSQPCAASKIDKVA